jgi:uncharacterized protein with GYD domain
MAILSVIPEAYRQTYLAQFQGKGVTRTPEDLPFAQYVLEQIFEKFGGELNDTTSYAGEYDANGASAIDVANGFGTILAAEITAGNVTPEVLGAINSANAVSQYKKLWRKVPSKWRKKKLAWTMYMSHENYEAYEDNLETLNVNTGRGDDMLKPVTLRGSAGLCTLKPVSWMGASDRIILTPKANMIVGGDAIEQDLAQMNIVQNMWGFDLGIAAAIGFQFRYLPLLICNEAA